MKMCGIDLENKKVCTCSSLLLLLLLLWFVFFSPKINKEKWQKLTILFKKVFHLESTVLLLFSYFPLCHYQCLTLQILMWLNRHKLLETLKSTD